MATLLVGDATANASPSQLVPIRWSANIWMRVIWRDPLHISQKLPRRKLSFPFLRLTPLFCRWHLSMQTAVRRCFGDIWWNAFLCSFHNTFITLKLKSERFYKSSVRYRQVWYVKLKQKIRPGWSPNFIIKFWLELYLKF